MKRPRCGFTLTELVVVISIIVILAAMLLPGIKRVHESALSIKCSGILSQMGSANLVYASENKGRAVHGMSFGPLNPDDPYGKPYDWGQWMYNKSFVDNLGIRNSSYFWPKSRVCPKTETSVGNIFPDYKNYVRVSETYTYNFMIHQPGMPRYDWYAIYQDQFVTISQIPSVTQSFMFSDGYKYFSSPNFGPYSAISNYGQYEAARHSGTANCVFWDGHVEKRSDQFLLTTVAADLFYYTR